MLSRTTSIRNSGQRNTPLNASLIPFFGAAQDSRLASVADGDDGSGGGTIPGRQSSPPSEKLVDVAPHRAIVVSPVLGYSLFPSRGFK